MYVYKHAWYACVHICVLYKHVSVCTYVCKHVGMMCSCMYKRSAVIMYVHMYYVFACTYKHASSSYHLHVCVLLCTN